jgi:MFS transporter, ACS family, hexuronate transporter
VPAALGLFWVPLWVLNVRSTESRQRVRAQAVSLRLLLGNSSAWAVMLCRFFIGPVMQFYWYWIPSYLYGARHLTLTQVGFLGWIPFLLGDAGGILGGWCAGWLQRRGLRTYNVRRITMFSSAALCVVSLAVPFLRSTTAAFFAIGLAMLADNFLSANMFGAVTDLFADNAVGRATGLTGVAGGLSGLLFPLLTGYLVDRYSYAPVFVLISVMPLAGAFSLFVLGRQYRSPELSLPGASL